MLARMYRLSVWDAAGKQFLPVFAYDWDHVMAYCHAETAIIANTTGWISDHPEQIERTP
jgi:hypothetical protein